MPLRRISTAGQLTWRTGCRNLSSQSNTAIYHSVSHNPWFNLAFEDWIFRKTPAEQIVLFTYRNRPCVIIGRNQNPWREINLRKLQELNIAFVRRKSGGGTVYHDLGNTNYCVFMPRTQFDRKTNAQLVSTALNNLSIDTYVNERNDICIDGFKISSAFKLVNARAYHHGTMLIDAKLSSLKGVLSNKKDGMVSKGVESVPSPVSNLIDWDSLLDHSTFIQAVSKQFRTVYGGSSDEVVVDDLHSQNDAYVKRVYEELQSWDWQWGQTPEFTQNLEHSFSWGKTNLSVTAKHGVVIDTSTNLTGGSLAKTLRTAMQSLVGEKYEDTSALRHFAAGANKQAKQLAMELEEYLMKAL